MYNNKICCVLAIKILNKISEDGTPMNSTIEQINDYALTRESFFEMLKPMINTRLEWSIDRILDHDLRWTECNHNIDETEIDENKVEIE